MQVNHVLVTSTAKNTVISLDFLVWKLYGKAQFSHSFGRGLTIIQKLFSGKNDSRNFGNNYCDNYYYFIINY